MRTEYKEKVRAETARATADAARSLVPKVDEVLARLERIEAMLREQGAPKVAPATRLQGGR